MEGKKKRQIRKLLLTDFFSKDQFSPVWSFWSYCIMTFISRWSTSYGILFQLYLRHGSKQAELKLNADVNTLQAADRSERPDLMSIIGAEAFYTPTHFLFVSRKKSFEPMHTVYGSVRMDCKKHKTSVCTHLYIHKPTVHVFRNTERMNTQLFIFFTVATS